MKHHSRISLIHIIFLVTLVIYGCVWWWLRTVMVDIEQSAERAHEYKEKMQQELSVRTLLNQTRPDIDILSRTVLAKDGDVDFIEYLETLAKQQQVTLVIASVREETMPSFDMRRFQLTAKGSWSSVMRFLQLVEQMPIYTSVQNIGLTMQDSIAMAPSGKSSSLKKTFPTWQLALEFVVYKVK